MRYIKEYVDVLTHFAKDGTVLPLCIYWPDGTEYRVDKVLDIRKADALHSNGAGTKYTCLIRGHKTSIYLEENRWFAERKIRSNTIREKWS